MNVFTLLEPASEKLINDFVRREAGWKPDFIDFLHPQEDHFKVSEKYPIFAVADGVTLEHGAFGKYPNPSGAGEVAKIFCEEVIRGAEEKFHDLSENAILRVFEEANTAVGEYNRSKGLTKETINYWDNDLFAATAAFAVVREKTVFWASLCDSYVARFSADGQMVFKSPKCWPNGTKFLPDSWGDLAKDERKKILRERFRNGIGNNGELIGYGVVTGEASVLKYLNYGSFMLRDGELVALVTDGFEEYLDLPEFLSIFRQGDRGPWPPDLETRVKKFTAGKENENFDKYGHERTLIIFSA